jgi:hypothetical protein
MTSIFSGVISTAVFALPLALVGWWLHRRQRRFREYALDPFTELPLRPPGESLRLKIESLRDEFDETLSVTALVCFGSAMFAVNSPASGKWVVLTALAAIVVGSCGWSGRKLARIQRQLWDHRLGFTGERLVGEELNQLLAVGFKVFHDVPFDGFNVDHVLVGPPGVYVVETKSTRKRAAIKGLERATVYSDGTVLKFPLWTNTYFIEQARRNAATVSEWLTKATGEAVSASAILTLPGWRIERVKAGEVNVLRPDEIKRSFPSKPKQPLTPEQIQRIAHQLTERCRIQATTK